MSELEPPPSEWPELRRKDKEKKDKEAERLLNEVRLADAEPEIKSIMKYFYEPKELQAYLGYFPDNNKIQEAICLMNIEEPYKSILADKQNQNSVLILKKYRLDMLMNFAKKTEEQDKAKQENESQVSIIELEDELNGQNKDFTMRRKVLALMLLTFQRLDLPEDIKKERVIEFFHGIIGGNRKNLSNLLANPTASKNTPKSIKPLCDDLNFVRDYLGKLGLSENVRNAISEIENLIEDLREKDNEQ
jgi:hypothetical protein